MQPKTAGSTHRGTRKQHLSTLRYASVDAVIVLLIFAVLSLTWGFIAPVDYAASAELILLIALVHIATLYLFGVYQRIWSRTSGHGMMVIINAVAVATMGILSITLILQQEPLSLPVILIGNLLSLCGFIAVRYRSRLPISFRWRLNAMLGREFPKQGTRILIIGAGESGQALAWRLMHRMDKNQHHVVGFIDDDPDKQNMFVEGRRVLGMRKDIVRITESFSVDIIVVAIHNITGPEFREILNICENTTALIKVVPPLEAMMTARHSQALLRDVQAEDLIGRSMVKRFEAVDLTPVTNKVILITGAAGSIGWELSRQIMQYSPTKVVLLDNNESGLHDLTIELGAKFPDIDLVPALADITIRSSLRAVYEKFHPQIIFHTAAYKHVPMLEYYPREAIRVNIGGTRNVASLAQEYRAERFVLISSDKAVNPNNIMGATKRACELLLHALSQSASNRTLFTAVRFGNVLGSRGSVVPTFNRQIDSGGPVTVTDAEMTRYFMSIPEAVNLIIHAACMTTGNDIYVLGMGEVVRIVELAERMIRLRGLRPYKDIEIQFTGIRPGEKMHEELFHGDEKPFSTIHPDIMQVNTSDEPFNWQEYQTKLERLEKETSENSTNLIGRLLQIITPAPVRVIPPGDLTSSTKIV